MNTHAKKIVEALDALGKQIRAMEQRQPHVHYSLGSVWAKDKEARDALQAMQAEFEAIGAGGVEPLRKCSKLVQIQEPDCKICAPIGYIHPQNIGRLERGEPVAVRKNGWDGEPGQIPVYTEPQATPQGLDADMFWDADDPEICQTSINNVVVEVDSYRGLKVGDTVTIQRAVKLPDLEVRITMVPDSEGNGDLEWDVIDAAQAKHGGE